jgi:hypothetical protein
MLRLVLCLVLAVGYTSATFADPIVSGARICKHKNATGTITTWVCEMNKTCCVAETFGIYACGSKPFGYLFAAQAEPPAISLRK